jgi:hypothetical protein
MIVVHSLGPIYWGVERNPADRRVLTRAWLVEDQVPWRKSIAAFRIRVWRYAVHLGICRRLEPDSDERPWFPKYAPVTEISTWRRLHEEVQVGETPADPTGEQVRQAEPGRPLPGDGAGDS